MGTRQRHCQNKTGCGQGKYTIKIKQKRKKKLDQDMTHNDVLTSGGIWKKMQLCHFAVIDQVKCKI